MGPLRCLEILVNKCQHTQYNICPSEVSQLPRPCIYNQQFTLGRSCEHRGTIFVFTDLELGTVGYIMEVKLC